MTDRPCAVAACCAPAPDGLPMCRLCWSRTPRRLQNALNRAWRADPADRRVHEAALAAAARWHVLNPPRPRQPRRSPRTTANVARLATYLGGSPA